MNYLLAEEGRRRLNYCIGLEYKLADKSNPLENLTPEEVKRVYRFHPETILFLLDIVAKVLQKPFCDRGLPLPPMINLLYTLEFLATGGFFHTLGTANQISKTSAFRCIERVCTIICNRRNSFIRWPTGASAQKIKEYFFHNFRLPGIIGLLDGVLVGIKKPAHIAFKGEYICRKRLPAINCQVCCGPDNMIYQASVQWPGATKDAWVFKNSSLRTILENANDGSAVLGDSAYPLKSFLLTPVQTVSTAQEENYNWAHCCTQVKVEQTFGILKARYEMYFYKPCWNIEMFTKHQWTKTITWYGQKTFLQILLHAQTLHKKIEECKSLSDSVCLMENCTAAKLKRIFYISWHVCVCTMLPLQWEITSQSCKHSLWMPMQSITPSHLRKEEIADEP